MPVNKSTRLVIYLSNREVPSIQIGHKGQVGYRHVFE